MAVSISAPKKLCPCNVRVGFGACWLLVVLSLVAMMAAPVCSSTPRIITYRPVDGAGASDGKFVIPSGEEVDLIIFGTDLSNDTIINFTSNNESCIVGDDGHTFVGGGSIKLATDDTDDVAQRAYMTVQLPTPPGNTFYFCVSESELTLGIHQGSAPWLAMVVRPALIPLSAEIVLIVVLMVLSGLFSGLNLGLMSLDPTTLKIITQSGTDRQRIYAKIIYRVRRHGNYLLCTLLLGNVLVNSTLTIILDDVLPSGIYAVIASTLAIVLFGEIIPQAICSRHGLLVGAWTIPLTLVAMVITLPMSLPLSLILNLVLGKEIGSVYNRDQLLKLLHVTKDHHDMANDEVDVISGVLGYKKKQAKDVMTNFEDIFCLSIDSVLDFHTMKEIYDSGFSRIPVYQDTKENIVHLLYIRDLAFVDADDKTLLASHLQFYQREVLFFFEDTTLEEILKGFLEGRCHLGVIQTIIEVSDKDPEYAAVGVITLEDILEEILQREIVDETDRFVDNRSFKPRSSARTIDVGEIEGGLANSLTSQQRLVVYQFLSTEIEPFTPKLMSSLILKRLLTQSNIVKNISYEAYKRKNLTLYSMGCPANFFCLILEGCVEVEIGKDGLKFESRSFSYFGAQTLLLCVARPSPDAEYRPDFTARPASDCLAVIITQAQYMAARRASVFEGGRNSRLGSGGSGGTMGKNDVFSTEWAKAEALDSSSNKGSAASSSFFQRSFLSPRPNNLGLQQASEDRVHLLSHHGSGSSSASSSGGASPAGIRMVSLDDRAGLGINQDQGGVAVPRTAPLDGRMEEGVNQSQAVPRTEQARTNTGDVYQSTNV